MTHGLDDGKVVRAAAALAALLALEKTAWADNLGGLVYIVFVWPIGALCFVLLLVLCIVSIRRYRKGVSATGSRILPAIFLAVSAALAVVYPLLVLMLDGAYQARAPISIMVMSIVPVELMAVPVILMSIAGLRK